MKKMKFLIVLMLISNSSLYSDYRLPVLKEYIMMKLCIKDKDGIFTPYIDARDNCACAIDRLSYYTLRDVKRSNGGNSVWKIVKEELEKNYNQCENLAK